MCDFDGCHIMWMDYRRRSETHHISDFLWWIITPPPKLAATLLMFWSVLGGFLASCSVWIIRNPLQVGIVVVLWARFVWPFLMTPCPWNKNLPHSSLTFSHFPIKQLSLCHCWPLREYCKASIVASILPQSGFLMKALVPWECRRALSGPHSH